MTQLSRRLDRIEAAESPRIGLVDLLRSINGDAEATRRLEEDGGRSPLIRALAECRSRGEKREQAPADAASLPQRTGDQPDA